MKKPKAIDLYSGVGGWALGLRLAGIDVVGSYEFWGAANETNFKNNGHHAQTVDIRRLSIDDLPDGVDIVVGSPPCTQFSFSNRGGGGDIADGMKDIIQFLKIVAHTKPRVWAMENVPRVARIIDAELKPGGVLAEFANLGCVTHIVDMAEYGLPQRRRRCIAGNFDIELLKSYRSRAQERTLGEIVSALAANPIVDPLFGVTLSRDDLTDHVEEDVLSTEEVRINRSNKMTHTIYNAMPFPDPLDRSVRTITATCTRVSRESVVIAANKTGSAFRRLTLRERASLQGFPTTFQFYGTSYGQKLRMIGNAVPPAFSYLMGHALQEHSANQIRPLHKTSAGLARPEPLPVQTPSDRVGSRYPTNRTFKFAIPNLQLKSGVRFELQNLHTENHTRWRVAFFFGTSKAIHALSLDGRLGNFLAKNSSRSMTESVQAPLEELKCFVQAADIPNMQTLWTHRGPGGTQPFMVLDKMDEVGGELVNVIAALREEACLLVERAIQNEYGKTATALPGLAKLRKNAPIILSGLFVGATVNPILDDFASRTAISRRLLKASN